jgi:SNF2 family DNA or RNA helicase
MTTAVALMLAHPSDRKACKSKTTLIVCPVSLMTQWKDEIEKKADGRLRVLIHHGKGKAGASESRVSRLTTLVAHPFVVGTQKRASCRSTTWSSRLIRLARANGPIERSGPTRNRQLRTIATTTRRRRRKNWPNKPVLFSIRTTCSIAVSAGRTSGYRGRGSRV